MDSKIYIILEVCRSTNWGTCHNVCMHACMYVCIFVLPSYFQCRAAIRNCTKLPLGIRAILRDDNRDYEKSNTRFWYHRTILSTFLKKPNNCPENPAPNTPPLWWGSLPVVSWDLTVLSGIFFPNAWDGWWFFESDLFQTPRMDDNSLILIIFFQTPGMDDWVFDSDLFKRLGWMTESLISIAFKHPGWMMIL